MSSVPTRDNESFDDSASACGVITYRFNQSFGDDSNNENGSFFNRVSSLDSQSGDGGDNDEAERNDDQHELEMTRNVHGKTNANPREDFKRQLPGKR